MGRVIVLELLHQEGPRHNAHRAHELIAQIVGHGEGEDQVGRTALLEGAQEGVLGQLTGFGHSRVKDFPVRSGDLQVHAAEEVLVLFLHRLGAQVNAHLLCGR